MDPSLLLLVAVTLIAALVDLTLYRALARRDGRLPHGARHGWLHHRQ